MLHYSVSVINTNNLKLIELIYRFHIVNNNGRIEKSVTAHQGACLAAQWSPDGAGLLTGTIEN